jgi:hypothetical protein
MIVYCAKADRLSVVIKRNNQVDLCLRQEKKKERTHVCLCLLHEKPYVCLIETKHKEKRFENLLFFVKKKDEKRLLGLICRLIKEQEYI